MMTFTSRIATLLVLLSSAALAEEKVTLDPNVITVEARRSPLQLNTAQGAAIQKALATENTDRRCRPTSRPALARQFPLR